MQYRVKARTFIRTQVQAVPVMHPNGFGYIHQTQQECRIPQGTILDDMTPQELAAF